MNNNERDEFRQFKERSQLFSKGKEVNKPMRRGAPFKLDFITKTAQVGARKGTTRGSSSDDEVSKTLLTPESRIKREVVNKSHTVNRSQIQSIGSILDLQPATSSTSSTQLIKPKTVVEQLKPKPSNISSSPSSQNASARFPVGGDQFADLQEARDKIISVATSLNGITYYAQAKSKNLFEFRCSGKLGNKRCKAKIVLYRAEDTKGPWFVQGLSICEAHNHPAHPKFVKDSNWRPRIRSNIILDPSQSFEIPITPQNIQDSDDSEDEFKPPLSQSLSSNRAKLDEKLLRSGLVIGGESMEVESEIDELEEILEGQMEVEDGNVKFSNLEKRIVLEASTQTDDAKVIDNAKVPEDQEEVEIMKQTNGINSSSDRQFSPTRILPSAVPLPSSHKRPRMESRVSRNLSTQNQMPTPSTSSVIRTPPIKLEVLDKPIIPASNPKLSLPQLQALLYRLNSLLRNKEIAEKLHRKGVDNIFTLLNLLSCNDTSFALFLNGFVGEDELKALPKTALEVSFKEVRDKLCLGS